MLETTGRYVPAPYLSKESVEKGLDILRQSGAGGRAVRELQETLELCWRLFKEEHQQEQSIDSLLAEYGW